MNKPHEDNDPDRTAPDENLAGDPSPSGDKDDQTVIQPQPEDRTVLDGLKSGSTGIGSGDADDKTVIEPVDADDKTVLDASPSGDDKTVIESPTADDKTVIEVSNTTDQSGVPSADSKTLISQNSGPGNLPTHKTLISESFRPGDDDDEIQSVRRIERFELEKVLGQGAFGTVYLARDPKLDRLVAIKVAKTGLLNSKTDIDRFNREARAAAQLRHPNIVPVYEVGQRKGVTFIVYDYIEGTTLKGMMKECGKLPPEDAVDLMIKIARAMDYAHSHAIIHRDMKPENILIDLSGQPHIADFGLARNEEKDATRTREGTLMGTPAYMSPEQASGQVSKVDRQSDVWSIGIILDEMLTARRAFSGTVVEVLTAVQTQPVKPIRTVDATLPVDLETICLKALEKEKEKRFASAGDLADELTRWKNGEPITLRRISVAERLWRWAKRNQTVAALLASLFVVLTVGATLSTMFGISATQSLFELREEQAARRRDQVNAVQTADPAGAITLLDELESHENRSAIVDEVRSLDVTSFDDTSVAVQRRAMLLLRFSDDESERNESLSILKDDMLDARPQEFVAIRRELQKHKTKIIPDLWDVVKNSPRPGQDLRAAAALAAYDPESAEWPAVSGQVVRALSNSSLRLSDWADLLKPVGQHLLGPLRQMFDNKDDTFRGFAASAIALMFSNDAETLTELLSTAEADQLGGLSRQIRKVAQEENPEVIDILGRRLKREYREVVLREHRDAEDQVRANHVLALLEAGQLKIANQELAIANRNGVRSYVIERAGDAKLEPTTLFRYLQTESDPILLQTAILALHRYSLTDIPQKERERRLGDLFRLYRGNPNSGVHGAIHYLVRKWQFDEQLRAEDRKLQSPDWPTDDRQWHHTPEGLIFVIMRDPKPFMMGTDDPIRGEGEQQYKEERPHQRTVGRSYAISMHEVTLSQFREFRPKHEERKLRDWSGDQPVVRVRWYGAVDYCNWLSLKAGIDKEQLGYRAAKGLADALPKDKVMVAHEDVVLRPCYRLPTSAEWEYASRGGTTTLRHYGSGDQLMGRYAWFANNAPVRPREVGMLLPNQIGVFDMLGNVSEWCQSFFAEAPPADNGLVDGDEGERGKFFNREFRGGSHLNITSELLDAARGASGESPQNFYAQRGFRLAITLPR